MVSLRTYAVPFHKFVASYIGVTVAHQFSAVEPMTRHEKSTEILSAARRPRGKSRFTQADVTRVIRAAMAAQLRIAAVRIEPDGTILVIPGTPSLVAVSELNPWDA